MPREGARGQTIQVAETTKKKSCRTLDFLYLRNPEVRRLFFWSVNIEGAEALPTNLAAHQQPFGDKQNEKPTRCLR